MKQLMNIKITFNVLFEIRKILFIILFLNIFQESFAQKGRISELIGFNIDIDEVPINNSNEFLHHVSIKFVYQGESGYNTPLHGASASIFLNFVFLDQTANVVGEYEIGTIDIFGNRITFPDAIGSDNPIEHYILYPESCNADISTATFLLIEHEFNSGASQGNVIGGYQINYNGIAIVEELDPPTSQLNQIQQPIVNQLASNVPLSLWSTDISGNQENVFVQPIDCGFSPNMQLAYVVPFGGCPPYTQTWVENNGHTASNFVTGCNWAYDGYAGITLPVYGLNQGTSYSIQVTDSSPNSIVQTAVQTDNSCSFLVNTLEVNDNPIPTGDYVNAYYAYNSISSTGLVAPSSNVNFFSDYVCLNPGFVAHKNSTFLAQTRQCQGGGTSSRFKTKQISNASNSETVSLNTSLLSTSSIQNIPNPFSQQTTFQIDLKEATNVHLEIYDIAGKLMAVLLDNQQLESGQHKINFDASSLSSGIYLYRLATEQENITKKMVLKK